MRNKSAQRKPEKHKTTSRGKISKRSSTIVSKTYNLESKKRPSGVRKRHNNLSVSKERQFLHSKHSYTKFTFARRKLKRMKVFARFKNEIWCMDLAYVDKLAKDNNGVKCLLVRQDLFDRTVDAKGMKTKDSKETVRAFLTMITKKNRPKKFGLSREQIFLEKLKNYAKLKEYKFTLQ